jgi:hypothetical protein
VLLKVHQLVHDDEGQGTHVVDAVAVPVVEAGGGMPFDFPNMSPPMNNPTSVDVRRC